jgi:prophage DNA circulation protein
MEKPDVREAQGIINRLMTNLATTIPQTGDAGSAARTAIGDLVANAAVLLSSDAIGAPLDNCFDLCRQAGANVYQFEEVRRMTEPEAPITLGGVLVKNSALALCLAQECAVIAAMTFTSRSQVDQLKQAAIEPFDLLEENAADTMDQATFQELVTLQAALVNHLVTTARPLPRMVNYQFGAVLPSLVIAYRLYADASRADELIDENKIVHPAFCPPRGRALSF